MTQKDKSFLRRQWLNLFVWTWLLSNFIRLWFEKSFMTAIITAELCFFPLVALHCVLQHYEIKAFRLRTSEALQKLSSLVTTGLKKVVNNQQENLAKDIVTALHRKDKETGEELEYDFVCKCITCECTHTVSISTFNQSYLREMKNNILNKINIYAVCVECNASIEHVVSHFNIREKE